MNGENKRAIIWGWMGAEVPSIFGMSWTVKREWLHFKEAGTFSNVEKSGFLHLERHDPPGYLINCKAAAVLGRDSRNGYAV